MPGETYRRIWIAGECHRCGRPFVSRLNGGGANRWCSKQCAKRNSAEQRQALEAGRSDSVAFYRLAIYRRDEWKCRICGKPLWREARVPHPLAPTIDHVVPLSRGGDHGWHNLQAAHFICNSQKGDFLHADDLPRVTQAARTPLHA